MSAKKKMIYDTDKWLKQNNDMIDRKNKMILEIKERKAVQWYEQPYVLWNAQGRKRRMDFPRVGP